MNKIFKFLIVGSLSGICIKRESPKLNTNQNRGVTCVHHSSVMKLKNKINYQSKNLNK